MGVFSFADKLFDKIPARDDMGWNVMVIAAFLMSASWDFLRSLVVASAIDFPSGIELTEIK